MTIEEQIATELIERTKWNESPHYAGRIEGDGWSSQSRRYSVKTASFPYGGSARTTP